MGERHATFTFSALWNLRQPRCPPHRNRLRCSRCAYSVVAESTDRLHYAAWHLLLDRTGFSARGNTACCILEPCRQFCPDFIWDLLFDKVYDLFSEKMLRKQTTHRYAIAPKDYHSVGFHDFSRDMCSRMCAVCQQYRDRTQREYHRTVTLTCGFRHFFLFACFPLFGEPFRAVPYIVIFRTCCGFDLRNVADIARYSGVILLISILNRHFANNSVLQYPQESSLLLNFELS